MNKTILTISFLIFVKSFCAFSQCTKRVDEFTKQTIIENEKTKIGKFSNVLPYFLKAAICFIDGSYLMRFQAEGPDIQTIESNSVIYFKFSNDSVLTIKNLKTDISTPTSGEPFTQGAKYTIWVNSLTLLLSKNDIDIFKTYEIVKVRCGNYDYKIKNDKISVFIDQISCIQKQ
jgi:hypothetical protein